MLRISKFLKSPIGTEGQVFGWVRSIRSHKNDAFIILDDGSQSAQIVIKPELVNGITTGACLMVKGTLVSGPKEVEIYSEDCQIVGQSHADYPLQKKYHTLEHLREHPHIRPRSNTISSALKIRSRLSFAIHQFFQDRDFYYIHTPIITGNDCEGAGELFELSPEEFFNKKAFLTCSGQLQAEIFACSLGQVYTFGPTFRAEKSHTQRHLAEFWMIEPEMAFYRLDDTISLAKSLIMYCCEDVLNTQQQSLNKLRKDDLRDLESIQAPWNIITHQKAIELTNGNIQSSLSTEQEKYLTDTYYKSPVVVTHFPANLTPFYMKQNGNLSNNFDILLPRVGEVIGGSEREENYEKLKQKMNHQQGLQWYLDLRKYGTVPHSGFGLGLERLIQFITGLSNIRDTIPLPRTPKSLEC